MVCECTLTGSLSIGQTLTGSLTKEQSLTGGLTVPEGGTKDYNKLSNKPKINGVELIGDRSFEDLGEENLTNIEILTIFSRVFGGN